MLHGVILDRNGLSLEDTYQCQVFFPTEERWSLSRNRKEAVTDIGDNLTWYFVVPRV